MTDPFDIFKSFTASETRAPRPLPVHMANSMSVWGGAVGAAVGHMQGILPWHENLQDQASVLREKILASGNLPAFLAAVGMGASANTAKMIKGLNAFMSHPYIRPDSAAECVLKLGNCELLDYGGEGRPVLLIPSLINPSYILDLMPGRSLTTFLKEHGYRPFLVNWAEPGPEELGFGVEDYIQQRLMPFLDHCVDAAQSSVPAIGYCMGGTLSYGLAAIAGEKIFKLCALAAPWDFHGKKRPAGEAMASNMALAVKGLPAGSPMPVDMLQVMFTSMDPMQSDRKFRKFASMDMESDAAQFFVAMETWANSGAPLVRQVAEETLDGWFSENKPAKGEWFVNDKAVDLADITCPVWLAAPEKDKLVPAESALAVTDALSNYTVHDPGAGHVGMMVGSKAKAGLWEPLVGFLNA